MSSRKTCVHERNIALQSIYKRIIKSQVNKNLLSSDVAISIILEQSAPRFYIAPERAKWLIVRYSSEKSKYTGPKRTLKQEMIEDLIQNYNMLREKFPHTPEEKIYEMVVEQPAKSFYVSYRVARDIIFNYTGRARR